MLKRSTNKPAQQLDIDVLEMDERHGYVEHKAEECWNAVALNAASKFVVQVEVSPQNQQLIGSLMRRAHQQLDHPRDLVLMTDGEAEPCFRSSLGFLTSPSSESHRSSPQPAISHSHNAGSCSSHQASSGP